MLNQYAHEKYRLSADLSLHTGATWQPLYYCPAMLTMGMVLVQLYARLPCAREGHPIGCPSSHTRCCTEPAVRPGLH